MRNPFSIYGTGKPIPLDQRLDFDESAVGGFEQPGNVTAQEAESKPVISLLPIVLVASFLMLVIQMASLQIFSGGKLRALAEDNRTRERLILAPRGYIKDRTGTIIANNTVSFSLIGVPVDFPKEGLEQQVKTLCQLLGLEESPILDKVKTADKKSFEPLILSQDLTHDQSILFETKMTDFVGFSVTATPIRQYSDALAFSHLLGYAGVISDKEYSEAKGLGYSRQDYIGKIGVEQKYETYLRGYDGREQIEVDAGGKVTKTLGRIEPEPGQIVQLSIDAELQKLLYSEFSSGSKGAAIATDPRTGEVLALVSAPGFDNNLFAHGIKTQDYEGYLRDPKLPLFNRAIAGTYPPGSTVKPMVALAALDEKIVTDRTVINDRGVLVIPNQFDPNISYNFYGWKRNGLGPMTVRSAIAESSDIYFYTVAGGHHSSPIKGLGAEKLAEYYRRFNLGRPTGIDLLGEKSGIVADPAWKAEYYKDDKILSKWYLGDTYHIGIGQGDMLVTPLQVNLWTATFANNGVGYEPHVLKQVLDQEGHLIKQLEPKVVINHPGSPEAIKIVQEGMRQAVLAGSGRSLLSLPITSAGKTGTSQFDGSDPSRTHAWFTVYAPYENPQIAITVLVEAGGEGHAAAVPIAKKALQWWAENRYQK